MAGDRVAGCSEPPAGLAQNRHGPVCSPMSLAGDEPARQRGRQVHPEAGEPRPTPRRSATTPNRTSAVRYWRDKMTASQPKRPVQPDLQPVVGHHRDVAAKTERPAEPARLVGVETPRVHDGRDIEMYHAEHREHDGDSVDARATLVSTVTRRRVWTTRDDVSGPRRTVRSKTNLRSRAGGGQARRRGTGLAGAAVHCRT